jgi:hypothetical protein
MKIPLFLLLLLFFLCRKQCQGASHYSTGTEATIPSDIVNTAVHSEKDENATLNVDEERMMMNQSNTTTFSYMAYVTISNLHDTTDLTIEEAAYFDNALIASYEKSRKNFFHENNDDIHMIDAKILYHTKISEKMKTEDGNERGLRFRPRSRYYRYDYSLYFDFRCNLCGDKSGFWDRRSLRKVQKQNEIVLGTFGRKLCKALRSSPHDVFQTVKHCRIQFK